MNRFRKAGLLFVALVVPVLVFLFLKFFGTNHFDLPYYFPLTDATTGKVRMEGRDTVYYQISNLALPTFDGSTLGDQDLLGKVLVVHKVPTVCGDTCQKVLTQLQRILTQVSAQGELRILTLTSAAVDSSIQQAVGTYEGKWWLIQEKEDLQAEQLFKLSEKVPFIQTIPLHRRLVLIDHQGRIRGYYDALNPEEVDRLLVEIKILNYSHSLQE